MNQLLELGDNVYIRALDDMNWVVCRRSTVKDKKSKNFGKESAIVLGHFPSLDYAWQCAVEIVAKKAENFEHLEKLVLSFTETKRAFINYKK